MATRTQPTHRREALSRARIVEATVALLDAGGEAALTFRALGTRLATGSGALYGHVDDKADLLAAAVDFIVMRATEATEVDADPGAAIRALALGVFDAIDAHPWVGGLLAREPWRPAVLHMLEGVGRPLQALGVPGAAQFDAATALLGYILGVAGQNAANARLQAPGADRAALLAEVATRWAGLDPAEHPFVRGLAARLGAHDDREQFLAGLDLIIAGCETLRSPPQSAGASAP